MAVAPWGPHGSPWDPDAGVPLVKGTAFKGVSWEGYTGSLSRKLTQEGYPSQVVVAQRPWMKRFDFAEHYCWAQSRRTITAPTDSFLFRLELPRYRVGASRLGKALD